MPRFMRIQNAQRLQRGQSLAEMSLGMIVIVVLLLGLLDLGRIYFIFVALEDSAGEAALYLSINPDCRTPSDLDSDGNPCSDPNNAQYRALHAGGNLVDWSDITINVTRPAVYGVGDPVSVEVRYTFPLLTPIIPQIVGFNPLTLVSSATQTIIAE